MGQPLYIPFYIDWLRAIGEALSILNWLAKHCERGTYFILEGPAELVKNQLLTD
jgi:hypothetical protein